MKALLPDVKASTIHNAVWNLKKDGKIESAGFGRYNAASKKAAPAVAEIPQSATGFVRPPSLARLMAGR